MTLDIAHVDPTRRSGQALRPIGTREEIDRLRLDPTNVATCSPKTNRNLGCGHFSYCRFRQIRDGATLKGCTEPLKGPEQIAVYYETSPAQGGESQIFEMPCWQFYENLNDRYEQMRKTGDVIKILAIAGQLGKDGKPLKFKFESTVRAHAKRDPNCDDCSQGKCIATKKVYDERPINKMPRPHERKEFRNRVIGNEIREQVLMEQETEMEDAAFDPEKLNR